MVNLPFLNVPTKRWNITAMLKNNQGNKCPASFEKAQMLVDKVL